MGVTDPGSAREEAERLVATLLATARLATSDSGTGLWGPLGGIVSGAFGHSGRPEGASAAGEGFATGAPECCICPVCRGIAALRDPSPEFAERLATGAGDLAAGVASLLRALASAGAPEPPLRQPAETASRSPGPAAANSGDDHVWRAATRTGHDSEPTPERDVWSVATRAEDGPVRAAAEPPADAAGSEAVTGQPTDRPAVPASRAPGPSEDVPGDKA